MALECQIIIGMLSMGSMMDIINFHIRHPMKALACDIQHYLKIDSWAG
jgi:hypothetical protein